MYLQYDDLCKRKLEVFDNWVKTFALPEQLCEIDVTASNVRFVTRFAKFYNLKELLKMFSAAAIFYAVSGSKDIPKLQGYTDVIIKKSKNLTNYMMKLCERTEAIRSGIINRSYDNMLKVSTDGRKAALDLTLVNETQVYDQSSKLVRCAENVLDIYKKYNTCTQIIFCDYSTPKSDSFNVYNTVRSMLAQRGIPDKEIAFIHSCSSESTRLKLYEKVNSGKIRVLIGSTFKLGIGANVQSKLKAVHHLDIPWRPADMIQREGRILRRGNENGSVFIFRYIAEGSFDSYSWQILETKQRFISQFLSGSSYQKSITDLENNVLDYAQVKALALSDPLIKQLAEKDNEIKKLRILYLTEKSVKEDTEKRIEFLTYEIPKTEEKYKNTLENKEFLDSINVEEYKKKAKKYENVLTAEKLFGKYTGETLFHFMDFSVIIPEIQSKEKPCIIMKRNNAEYRVEMSLSPKGCMKRIVNFLKNFNKIVDDVKESCEKMTAEKASKEKITFLTDKYEADLIKCKQEREKLIGLLQK